MGGKINSQIAGGGNVPPQDFAPDVTSYWIILVLDMGILEIRALSYIKNNTVTYKTSFNMIFLSQRSVICV